MAFKGMCRSRGRAIDWHGLKTGMVQFTERLMNLISILLNFKNIKPFNLISAFVLLKTSSHLQLISKSVTITHTSIQLQQICKTYMCFCSLRTVHYLFTYSFHIYFPFIKQFGVSRHAPCYSYDTVYLELEFVESFPLKRLTFAKI